MLCGVGLYIAVVCIFISADKSVCSNIATNTGFDTCRNALGMITKEITDDQLSASSSHSPQHGPQYGRLNSKEGEGAWCIEDLLTIDRYEYIQVDFRDLKVITGIGTQGRWHNGEGNQHARYFRVEYRRDNETQEWRQYVGYPAKRVYEGNRNGYQAKAIHLSPPLVTSQLRVVPMAETPRPVCMRVEFYGCSFEDNLISYQMYQGEYKGTYSLRDDSYDGKNTNEYLHNGLGQLIDGILGANDFRLGPTNYPPAYEWVGWQNTTNLDPEIIFQFQTIRNVSEARFHFNNFYTEGVSIPTRVRIHFGVDDGYYYTRDLVEEIPVDFEHTDKRWISINLQHRIGRFLKCKFYHGNRWLLLDEVSFISEEFTGPMQTTILPSATVPSKSTIGEKQIDLGKLNVTCPGDISMETSSSQAKVTWSDPTVSGNDTGLSATCTPPSGSLFNAGETDVTCSTTDSAFNTGSCMFTVNVFETKPCRDNQFDCGKGRICIPLTLYCNGNNDCEDGIDEATCDYPQLNGCPDDVTVGTNQGTNYTEVWWTEPNPSSYTTIKTREQSHSPGHRFEIVDGKPTAHTVRYWVQDVYLSDAQCLFNITVIDNESPVVSCPSDSSNFASRESNSAWSVSTDRGSRFARLYWPPANATDNSGTVGSVTSNYKPGDVFRVSNVAYQITYTAIDEAGNTGYCSFFITVKDTKIPSITCPRTFSNYYDYIYGFHRIVTDYGQSYATVTWSPPEVEGNSEGPVTWESYPYTSGDIFPLRLFPPYTVKFTASDLFGNSRFCYVYFTIIDVEPPTIICPTNIKNYYDTYFGINRAALDPGSFTSTVTWDYPTVFDNSGRPVNVMSTHQSGETFAPRFYPPYEVEYTAEDESGNKNSCKFHFLVSGKSASDL